MDPNLGFMALTPFWHQVEEEGEEEERMCILLKGYVFVLKMFNYSTYAF